MRGHRRRCAEAAAVNPNSSTAAFTLRVGTGSDDECAGREFDAFPAKLLSVIFIATSQLVANATMLFEPKCATRCGEPLPVSLPSPCFVTECCRREKPFVFDLFHVHQGCRPSSSRCRRRLRRLGSDNLLLE